MGKELRIYYESLEQAKDFIKPLLEQEIKDKKIEIKLIKLKKNYLNYSKKVAPLIYWKDPDILLTLVKEGKEYPLVMIEFSSAVFTEDHELQRFDGIVASAINNCIYVKISPLNKASQSGEHGGNTKFNPLVPYSVILKKFDLLFYHFNWECDKKGDLIVDDNYLSCPKGLANFNYLLSTISKKLENKNIGSKQWIKELERELLKENFFKEWKEKLDRIKMSNIKSLSSTRTFWDKNDDSLILKINRFGHAMDPERGMLSYYGTIYDKIHSKMMFREDKSTWYNSSNGENKIKLHIKEYGLKTPYDFFYCFAYGSGLSNLNEIKNLLEKISQKSNKQLKINFSEIVKKNYPLLSKPMRTMFKYSDALIIVDKDDKEQVRIMWKKFKFDENYDAHFNITPIRNRKSIDEDDVTYVTIHNILRPNGYKIIASSYPGAQGDRVILVNPGTGRSQERTYVDIIAYLPNKVSAIQENKGKFMVNALKEDMKKIKNFKQDKKYISALDQFFKRYDDSAPRSVKIGIGFWSNKEFKISSVKNLNLDNLDYFVYINHEMTKWTIWSSKSNDMFKINEGNLKMPLIFEVLN